MTKEQLKKVNDEVILLDMKDVSNLTGWCEAVVRNTFCNDKDFPSIKKGKKYQVELSALKNYLNKRRTKENDRF